MYTKNPRSNTTSTTEQFNISDLLEKYGDNPEAQREFFIHIQFPQGYVCPDCGCTEYRWLKSRNCMQCKCCSHQTHVLAGTIFQDSKHLFFKSFWDCSCLLQIRVALEALPLLARWG